MNTPKSAMSGLVAGIEALEPDQRAAYNARYVQNEDAEVTCKRLKISLEQYEALLKSARLALRRATTAGAKASVGH